MHQMHKKDQQEIFCFHFNAFSNEENALKCHQETRENSWEVLHVFSQQQDLWHIAAAFDSWGKKFPSRLDM